MFAAAAGVSNAASAAEAAASAAEAEGVNDGACSAGCGAQGEGGGGFGARSSTIFRLYSGTDRSRSASFLPGLFRLVTRVPNQRTDGVSCCISSH
jgi:hypothetical protein